MKISTVTLDAAVLVDSILRFTAMSSVYGHVSCGEAAKHLRALLAEDRGLRPKERDLLDRAVVLLEDNT